MIFRIWAGFARDQFLDEFQLGKSWSPNQKKRSQGRPRPNETSRAEAKEGGGREVPPPGLAGLIGSENRKEKEFGGSEKRKKSEDQKNGGKSTRRP